MLDDDDDDDFQEAAADTLVDAILQAGEQHKEAVLALVRQIRDASQGQTAYVALLALAMSVAEVMRPWPEESHKTVALAIGELVLQSVECYRPVGSGLVAKQDGRQ